MTALRSPLRSPLQPALRGPLQVSSSSGDIPALNLPFSSLANSTGSDARSAGWWNLMRGGNNVDEYIDATTGALTYGAHNRLTQTEDLSNAAWTRAGLLSFAQSGTTPGGYKAFLVIPTTANSGHSLSQTINIAGQKRMRAVVKAAGYNFIFLTDNTTFSRSFNLATGAVGTVGSGSGTIISLGNGWYEIYVDGTAAASTQFMAFVAATDSGNAYPGDGVSGVLVGEMGDLAFSAGSYKAYVPTTTAAIYSLNPRITYSRASLATRIGPTGLVEYGPHNLILNSATLSTQSVTVISGQSYTISAWGTGSVALSGGGSGTLTGVGAGPTPANRVSLTFTASTTSVTFTVTGSVTQAQLNIGPIQPYYPTTSAAYFGPRFTHDPATLAPLGLLVEGQKVQMLNNGGLDVSLATQTVTVTAAAHTLHFTGTGTVTLSGVSTAGPLVGTGTGEANRVKLAFTPTAGSLTLTVTGTCTNAQLELGEATSVIPNPTSGTMTRLADSASMTGTDFSSWYVTTQGVFLFTARIPAGDGYLFSVSDNTANNRISVRKSSGNLIYEVLSGGATQASISVAAPTVGTTAKIAVSFISNLFSFAVNGTAGTNDTAGTVPTVSRLTVGSNHTPANHWNESAALTRYFRTAFTAAKLQAITA